MIARRADTRARADFATWKMLAKLNGASALPAEAQDFLVSYRTLLDEHDGSRSHRSHHPADVQSYYAEMGGVGTPPDVRAGPNDPVTGQRHRLQAARRPTAKARKLRTAGKAAASGGADLRLPGRGLCRDPVLLAVMLD